MDRIRNVYSYMKLQSSQREMGCCTRPCQLGAFYGISALFLGLAILILVGWEWAYNSIIFNSLTLTNTSLGYNMWKQTPIPMYLELYLFNWTNSEEVINSKFTVPPNFEECGPYVYEEVHTRVNMQWHENGTVTYQQKRKWNFVPELTKGSLDDEITNVNVMTTTVAYTVRRSDIIIKSIVNSFLRTMNETITIKKTAKELLFEGYEDPILALASRINISIPFDKFGWFYGRNNSETYDGTFNMYTGRTDLELLGIVNLWNRAPNTKDYEGYCAYINGTSGELWPPVKDADRVAIFSPDICSTLWLQYSENVIQNEIEGRKYTSTNYTLDNGYIYPELSCFNVGETVPTGARNVSLCKFGAPAFVTLPHFYLADESFLENITGLYPNKSEHEFYISLEPKTGIPLNVRAQMQINVLLQPISGMNIFRNVKKTFIPVLWFRQTATLTEEYASLLKKLFAVPAIAVYCGYGAIGLGVLLLVVGIYITFKGKKKDDTEELLAQNT